MSIDSSQSPAPVVDQDGSLNSNLFMHDVTTPNEAEAQLAYLATVLASVPSAVISTDNELHIRSWNAQAETMYGWTASEAVGRDLDELCQSHFVAATKAEVSAAFIANGFLRTEIEQKRKDGQAIYVQATAAALRDAHGALNGCVIVNSDITERKQSEQALAASERHFRALIENIGDGIELFSADGSVVYASPSAARPLGYTQEELLGPGLAFLHPDDLPAAATSMAQVFATPGQPISQSYRAQHKDGTWRWIEGTATNLLADPAVGAIVVNFRDITERKQAEAALRASEERYRQLAAELEQRVQERTAEAASPARLCPPGDGCPRSGAGGER